MKPSIIIVHFSHFRQSEYASHILLFTILFIFKRSFFFGFIHLVERDNSDFFFTSSDMPFETVLWQEFINDSPNLSRTLHFCGGVRAFLKGNQPDRTAKKNTNTQPNPFERIDVERCIRRIKETTNNHDYTKRMKGKKIEC